MYGLNIGWERTNLPSVIGDTPWVLTGDFNICLSFDEKQEGNLRWTRDMTDFKDFSVSLGLTDLRFSGQLFTWWDSNVVTLNYRKLDLVLINPSWHSSFSMSHVEFCHRDCQIIAQRSLIWGWFTSFKLNHFNSSHILLNTHIF